MVLISLFTNLAQSSFCFCIGCNTNNHVEAQFRQLKDHVMNRATAFNACQLIDIVSHCITFNITVIVEFFKSTIIVSNKVEKNVNLELCTLALFVFYGNMYLVYGNKPTTNAK